jgi:hypothetical protein
LNCLKTQTQFVEVPETRRNRNKARIRKMKLIVSIIPLLISGVYCQPKNIRRNNRQGANVVTVKAGSQKFNRLTTELPSTTAKTPTCMIYTGRCANPDIVTKCKRTKIRRDCITEKELNTIRSNNTMRYVKNYDNEVMKIQKATKNKISNDAERWIDSIKTPKVVEGDFSAALSQIDLPCQDFVSEGYLLQEAAESKVHNYENDFTNLNPEFFKDIDSMAKKYLKLVQFKLGTDLHERLSQDVKKMKDKLIGLLQKNGNDALSQVTMYTGNLQECFDNECNYSFGLITLEVLNGAINLRMKGGSFVGAPKFEAKVDQLNMLSMLLFRVQQEFIGEGLIGHFKKDSNCAQYVSILPDAPLIGHDENDHKVVDCNDDEADGIVECMKWKMTKRDTEIKSLKQDIRNTNSEIENQIKEIEDLTTSNNSNIKKLKLLEQDIEEKNAEIENYKTKINNSTNICSNNNANLKPVITESEDDKPEYHESMEIENAGENTEELKSENSVDDDSVADQIEGVLPQHRVSSPEPETNAPNDKFF